MQNLSERDRLRYAGRIPQETLDYLASKEKERLDARPHWWEILAFLGGVLMLVSLGMLLVHSGKSFTPLLLAIQMYIVAENLRSMVRRWFP